MRNKNILVFGSTGFIGRSIVKRLLSDECKVLCPVRNPAGVKRNILSGDIGQIEVFDFDLLLLGSALSLVVSDSCMKLLIFLSTTNSFHQIINYFKIFV